MLKIVLVLIFAAFALTTALPLRNTFYEDVDDYSRDFIPKENADFDESAYDGYLLRRDPVERNPGLYQFCLISPSECAFCIYMRMFTRCLQMSWGSIVACRNACMMSTITEMQVSVVELSLSVPNGL